MKKMFSFLFAAFLAVFVLSTRNVYAGDVSCNETIMDTAWEWGTTLGKSGLDKDSILMKNKAERAQKCAERVAKQAQKAAGQAADDMKKKLGL